MMSQNQNENKDIAKDMSNQLGNAAKNQGKKALRKGAKVAKEAIKKVAKEAVKKIAAKVMMALGKALLAVLPYLLVVLAIVLVIVAGWYLLFETRGADGSYTFDQDAVNATQYTDGGYFAATTMSGKNKAIVDFYSYFGQKAYFQILGNDNTKLEQTSGDSTVRDYYNQEKTFAMNPNFLFTLDEFLFKGNFRYPEQFVQPVNYDSKTLTLKDLVDDQKMVSVQSTKYTQEGKKTTEKVNSVADYGLASVFKYKTDKLTHTVEGNYVKEDVFDASCECVKTVNITPEPFNLVMDSYPKKITLMDKAITFAGDFQFAYKTSHTVFADLKEGKGAANSDFNQVQYTTYYHYKTAIDAEGNPYTYLAGTYPLYKYKSGKVYETVPVPDPVNNKETKNDHYLKDYLYNFEAWVPTSVMTSFNFDKRVGEVVNVDLQIGESADSSKFARAYQYFDIAEKYGEQFDIDPYMIIAMMAQESGGNKDVNDDGIMQIIGSSDRMISAMDATGVKQTFTITQAGRKNVDDSVHWATMYLKYLKDKFDGDILKAVLGYNMGEGTVGILKNRYPDEWESSAWMDTNLIKDARDIAFNGNQNAGDIYYIPHVLQYYAGSQLAGLDQHSAHSESTADKVVNAIADFFGIKKKDYLKDEDRKPYAYHVGAGEVDNILGSAITFDKKILFSQIGEQDSVPFWSSEFSTTTGNLTADDFIKSVPDANGLIPPINDPNLASKITSGFGYRGDPMKPGTEFHKGVDIGVPIGTPVYAIADGKVEIAVGNQGSSKVSYGNYVKVLMTNGNRFLFGHLSQVVVKAGDQVKQGQLVGYSGNSGSSTGPHLHFEYRLGDTPIDGESILTRTGASLTQN